VESLLSDHNSSETLDMKHTKKQKSQILYS